ncbi:MAG: ISAs1 family transposase [Lamprobacter sp.]|uniref:ISAs1 family transposase n=1 Tax=Lamprobacter sp. TaxID=3100796 RepID=UPI002B25C09D|nr:ISAs1 family transposase [Lamprobacter sp.]MEA3643861.1 ISAs1 family transposase [Lamprobacter sp.]
MCETTIDQSLAGHFSSLEDPRCPINRRHLLGELIFIVIAATLCGADTWVAIAAFARAKEDWLRKFLTLPHGIPSHDTFGRVFGLLDVDKFEACFRSWSHSLCNLIAGEIIAIDGKTLRRSHDRCHGLPALHLVSAWATENRVVLGQVATDAKSNEITAIPKLLECLNLEGSTVTIDAMGCQTKIVEKIVDKGGNYVLSLKGNQGTLATEVAKAFDAACAQNYAGVDSDFFETVDHDHGRIETRRYWTLGDLSDIPRSELWKGMNAVGMVESQREVAGNVSTETRYYIMSTGTSAEYFAQATRGHWGIENELHWNLDVSFREDESRIRDINARQNLAAIRRITLIHLKKDNTKLGIWNKRLQAGWNTDYLEDLLFPSK